MYGPKWPFLLILSVCGSGVVGVKCWDKLCILSRASRTKGTLLDFREWCQVTRHPRIFRGLTGCQRTPGKWGVITNHANSETLGVGTVHGHTSRDLFTRLKDFETDNTTIQASTNPHPSNGS